MQIIISNVSLIYNQGTDFAKIALSNLNLSLEQGEFVGVIGHMGSGKTTFLQLLNGLLLPSEGNVTVNGMNTGKKTLLKSIREKVGMVFQNSEQQLFEGTVYEEIAFGLKAKGFKHEEKEVLIREVMNLTGLDFARDSVRNPFELSGGEQKKLAIAGVLVSQPEILALDEPFAGLDCQGRRDIARLLQTLNQKGITVILVSHDMDMIYSLVTRILLFRQGAIVFDGEPERAFDNQALMQETGVEMPVLLQLSRKLQEKGCQVAGFGTVEAGIKEISGFFGGK